MRVSRQDDLVGLSNKMSSVLDMLPFDLPRKVDVVGLILMAFFIIT